MGLAGLLAAAILPAPTTWASGLQVSPIGLRLAAGTPADALWLTNTGSEILHAQVRVFRWIQQDGQDMYDASRDLLASPPMVTIAPGGKQMVRVIRTGAPPDGAETAYRVIVDELPNGKHDGLNFVLRYSVPVFLAPKGDPAVKATLHTEWITTPSGPMVRIRNDGNGHAQIAELSFTDASGKRTTLVRGLVGYALPGSTMSWPTPKETPPATGVLKARVNSEPVESTLVTGAGGR
ncbi:molecular chaperone [Rothia nasimurium]